MYSENLTHNTFNQSGVAITERTQGSPTGLGQRFRLLRVKESGREWEKNLGFILLDFMSLEV
jgi:hypothetical protein